MDLPQRGTSLEDLPDDSLVKDIFSRIGRIKDIRSIRQVSKRMKDLMAPKLVESNMYRSMKFGHFAAREYGSLLCSTVMTFLKEPKLALYVEEIELRWGSLEQNAVLELPKDKLKGVLDVIFMQTEILQWKAGEGFVSALKHGSQGALVALLLLLLENLTVLNITTIPEDKWLPWAVQNSVTTNFFPQRFSSGFASLQVVDISSPSMHTDRFCTLGLSSVTPFFVLPSIDRINADSVRFSGSFKWGGSYKTSTLRHLSFSNSYLELAPTLEILDIPKLPLDSFSLDDLYATREEHERMEETIRSMYSSLTINRDV